MNARKCSGRFAYARKTFGTKPSFDRDPSMTARTSSGISSSEGAPKREGAALCAAPSLNGGWLLLGDVPAGDIDRRFLPRFVDVDRVVAFLQIGHRRVRDGGLRDAVLHHREWVRRFGVELRAGALVDVGRLIDAFRAAGEPQLDDDTVDALQHRRRTLLGGVVLVGEPELYRRHRGLRRRADEGECDAGRSEDEERSHSSSPTSRCRRTTTRSGYRSTICGR